jgi:hypothetical protein
MLRFAIIAAATMAVLPSTAEAGGRIFDPSLSTCTTANCSSQQVNGTVASQNGNADPFTVQVWSFGNECLRFQTLSQTGGTDLEVTVVSPNGSVFRNDDAGIAPCGLCSLVKFIAQRGWHDVHIQQFSGAAVNSDFDLRYGRYPNGNANCAAPTPPALSATAAARKSGGSVAPTGTGPSSR